MLSKLDEAMLHQVAMTFDYCEPSDHRFYDRHYVEACDPEGSLALASGLALYKNTNVFDGFFCVQSGGKQWNLRLSRQLRDQIDEQQVGPLSLEIVEPLQTVRLIVEPGDHPVAADLRWEGFVPPTEETEHFSRVEGRVAEHIHRYNQVGRTSGWVEIDGERSNFSNWWGSRDHSWGVRAGVGGFEPRTGATPPALSGLLYTWFVFSTEELAGYLQVHEDGAGERVVFDGLFRWRETSGRSDLKVEAVEYDLSFPDGSRNYEHASIAVTTEDGQEWDIRCEPLFPPWVMRGTGYDSGYDDGKGLGVYRGSFLKECDTYDISHPSQALVLPEGKPLPHFHREQLVRVSVNGARGTGHFTVIPVGELKKYGIPAFSAEEFRNLMRIGGGG